MVVAGTAQIGVVEEGGGTVGAGRGGVVLAGEERGDALGIEDAELDGAGGDRLEPGGIETAIGVQNPQASPETLFG